MITAVDTNVFIDVFRNDPQFGTHSSDALRRCLREGKLVACDVVWAELCAIFPTTDDMTKQMDILAVEYSAMTLDASSLTGEIWRQYRATGGKRTRVIADFMVAAHAMEQADRLLTRDRGFYRTYFKDLSILTPADPSK